MSQHSKFTRAFFLVVVFSTIIPGISLAQESDEADEAFLVKAQVGADGPGLLAYFRRQTLTEADRQHLRDLIRQLGDNSFGLREQASKKLAAFGAPAIPFLRVALSDGDLEISRRAGYCLEEIERGPGPALPMAAARRLAKVKPDGAVVTLLNYLPYVDDETVEEEVLEGLMKLSQNQAKLPPELHNDLKNQEVARRSAAAYVLGGVGKEDLRGEIRKLLTDPSPKVRLRAAQGLLLAKDKEAVPALIALLIESAPSLRWQAEEALFRIAGEQAPAVATTGSEKEGFQKARDAWTTWWRDNNAKVDLTKLGTEPRLLGLTLVAELDTNKVWETGPDGKLRWKMEQLQGPIDAQILPGNRVLIAENHGQRVTERDMQGKVLWEKRIPNQNPIACRRLPNGNTFIATYNTVLEVNREGKEVFQNNLGQNIYIYGATRLRNGHVVCISNQEGILELDANLKEVRRIRLNTQGGWCGVEALPGGRYLVALTARNLVMEVDATGKSVWECSVPSACSAVRLPSGNTLVACMNHRKIVEVNRAGKTVWEQRTDGRPFRAYRR